MVAIEACDVTYRRCGLTLIQRVSLCADRGEVLALLGPPGSGVNTLLLLLAGVLPDAWLTDRIRPGRRCTHRRATG